MNAILYTKSICLRSNSEVNVVVWGNLAKNRDHTYRNVSRASLKRVANLINRTDRKPQHLISTSVTVYSDCNFGVRRSFYFWED